MKVEAPLSVTLNFLLYLPGDYDQRDAWPLLLFLHGAGERGDDLELVKVHGPPKLIAAGKDFPFIVVSPQCPEFRAWHALELTALLDHLEQEALAVGMAAFGHRNRSLVQQPGDLVAHNSSIRVQPVVCSIPVFGTEDQGQKTNAHRLWSSVFRLTGLGYVIGCTTRIGA